MHNSDKNYVVQVLQQTARRRIQKFTGLGVVFYNDLTALQYLALGHPHAKKPSLPITGIQEVADTLAASSDISSPWHDGFHLVDMRSRSLTHLSQFLAPSLGDVPLLAEDFRPSGARQMAALLTSKTPGILHVGLLSVTGDTTIYSAGNTQVQLATS